jgi:hypothetical protein
MSNKHVFKDSSAINYCDYDEDTKTLKIKFHSGDKEHKFDAQKAVYDALKAAESPGKHFHQHIRGKFAEK